MNPTNDVPLDRVALMDDDMFLGMGVSNDDAMHNLELRLF
jgi:hypothetical protein